MSAKRSGLGRGLGALIKEVPKAEAEAEADAPASNSTLSVSKIKVSPWQPRKNFSRDALKDLVSSVREHGVLQPLIVRKVSDEYELIAGERRFRAACEAKLAEVPVVIMDVSDREALELALIENLQREDLDPIEEAEGYKLLADKFSMTQEQVSDRVGKARATVANSLRLLELPDGVKQLLSNGLLSIGHAKVLLGLEIPEEQQLLAKRIEKEGLSVRALEKVVANSRKVPKKPRAEKEDVPSSHVHYLGEQLQQKFGTSVRLTTCKTLANGKKVKGKIEIDYYSPDDLDRILHMLGVVEDL